MVVIAGSKESAQECRRFIRDANNLVCCLTIEFEIEFCLRSTVVPLGKKFEFTPSQAFLHKRDTSDSDAHTRRLPSDPSFLRNCRCRGDHAVRDETYPTFGFARENKYLITFNDVLAAIHRLLRVEFECFRQRIAYLSFDCEYHVILLSYGLYSPMVCIDWRKRGLCLGAEKSQSQIPLQIRSVYFESLPRFKFRIWRHRTRSVASGRVSEGRMRQVHAVLAIFLLNGLRLRRATLKPSGSFRTCYLLIIFEDFQITSESINNSLAKITILVSSSD